MADNFVNLDELINNFCSVTSADRNRAKLLLELASWDLDRAVTTFFDEGPLEQEEDDADGSATDPLDMGSLKQAVEREAAPLSPSHSAQMDSAGHSRFGTISDLHRDEASTSHQEEQAFYVGGSEKSGQQVLSPGKKVRIAPDGFVNSLFQSARQNGWEEVINSSPPHSSENTSSLGFRGTGYRLGENSQEPLEAVGGPQSEISLPQVTMTLKMWNTGFSVESGDLRLYSDERNQEFLRNLSLGQIPEELTSMVEGQVINLKMEDHRTEDFVKPSLVVKPFTGSGHMLGSPAPATEASPPKAEGSSTSTSPPILAEDSVDSSKPITSVQIRLSDGQRMVAKFNTTSTVGDVRKFILASHPQYATARFVLMTTFPNKDLQDEAQTLEEAKLCNAVIMQRLL
ncbi:hypothetical protein ACOMHN_027364 [Nucella lapillus]